MDILTKPIRKEKPPLAIQGVTRWLQRPIWPCELIPAGKPGLLIISTDRGGQVYEVVSHATGFRLAKETGESHDLPTDLSSCSCGDFTFRGHMRLGGCKPMSAMRAGLAQLFDCTIPADTFITVLPLPVKAGAA